MKIIKCVLLSVPYFVAGWVFLIFAFWNKIDEIFFKVICFIAGILMLIMSNIIFKMIKKDEI